MFVGTDAAGDTEEGQELSGWLSGAGRHNHNLVWVQRIYDSAGNDEVLVLRQIFAFKTLLGLAPIYMPSYN